MSILRSIRAWATRVNAPRSAVSRAASHVGPSRWNRRRSSRRARLVATQTVVAGKPLEVRSSEAHALLKRRLGGPRGGRGSPSLPPHAKDRLRAQAKHLLRFEPVLRGEDLAPPAGWPRPNASTDCRPQANATHREPWNKCKIVGQKAPFKPKDIWALRVRLQIKGRVRELALFNLGIDSKLRGCDLVGLKVRDLDVPVAPWHQACVTSADPTTHGCSQDPHAPALRPATHRGTRCSPWRAGDRSSCCGAIPCMWKRFSSTIRR